jgi:hypothetical protein
LLKLPTITHNKLNTQNKTIKMQADQQFYFQKILQYDDLPELAGQITLPANMTSSGSVGKPYFVGVIDSSGSMSNAWKPLATTYNAFIAELSQSLGTTPNSEQI